jgi:TatD DNase family protein
MFIDTHCHINMMVKKDFDVMMTQEELQHSIQIAKTANSKGVSTIINIGTSDIESKNCITIAQACPTVLATIGIHPNDLTENWRSDLKELTQLLRDKQKNKIVGIGECGLDFHYPKYDVSRQKDAFKIQIELALEHSIALVVHTRDARDETLRSLEEFKGQITKGIIHCFSEDLNFAKTVIEWGFAIGIGGIITYPKNNELRKIVATVPLESIVLETDAPFLPIQSMRGKQNHPQYIIDIAQHIAELRNETLETIASKTTPRAQQIFGI